MDNKKEPKLNKETTKEAQQQQTNKVTEEVRQMKEEVTSNHEAQQPKKKTYHYIHLSHSGDKDYPYLVRYNRDFKEFKLLEDAIDYVRYRISKNPYLIYRGIWNLENGSVNKK